MTKLSINPPPTKCEGEASNLVLAALLWFSATILIAGIVTPLYPKLPTIGLDPSWAFAMQEAVAQRLLIGKDVIFTFGPYASLFRSIYQPQTDLLGILGGLFLSIIFSTLLLIHFRHLQRWTVLAVTVIFCWLTAVSNDSLLFVYPLLLALTLYSLIDHDHGSNILRVLFTLCTAGLGLLPLIKGSLLPLCLCIGILCAALAWLCKERNIAIFTLLVPPAAALALWLLAGQSVSTLLPFFRNILPLISGYSDAMATYGEIRAIITYVAICGLLLISILLVRRPWIHTLYLLLVFSLYLFLSFKAAFVRVDHIAIALGSLLLAVLFAAQYSRFSLWIPCAAGCIFFAMQVTSYDLLDIQKNLISRYVKSSTAIIDRVKSPQELKASYLQQLSSISQQDPIPALVGTSDIYPWDISSLIASGNKWSPRPIFQSYASYTPALALANEAHLLSDNAPDNVFMKVSSIDGRLPSMEDGVSWPTILRKYTPVSISGNYLVFRREQLSQANSEGKPLVSQIATLGQLIEIPKYSGAVFTRIALKPTLRGKIDNIILKRDGLSINIELNDGGVRKFHFVPSMAESGFIISPLIESIFDLAVLAEGTASRVSDKTAVRFSITADNVTSDWQDTFEVQFTQLDIPARKLPIQNLFDERISPSIAIQQAPERTDCAGFVDAINDTPAGTAEVLGRKLQITGWTALSTKEAKLADQVFITLTDESGVRNLYPAKILVRPDLAAYFKSPGLAQAGFISTIDAQQLVGNYKVGVVREADGNYEHCQLLQKPILINTLTQAIEPSQRMRQAQTKTYCEGGIESINGASTDRPSNTNDTAIEVDGWSVLSSTEGTLPKSVFIKLTDEKGISRLYPTRTQLRPDVEKHFGNSQLAKAGFSTRIDARGLSGKYKLSLLRFNGDTLEQCPGPEQKVLINTGSLPNLAMLHAQQSPNCEGHLDSINGESFDALLKAGPLTSIKGWTVLSSLDGRLPEKVFVTLKNQAGITKIFATERKERNGISSSFENQGLESAKFSAQLDTEVLQGTYWVGILRSNGDKFEACKSLEQSITVN